MSTVYGKVVMPSGDAFVGSILFRPLSTPLVDSPDLITTADISVTTDALGDFSQVLRAGIYNVLVGASKAFRILVPDDAASYQLLALITSEVPSSSEYIWEPGEVLPLASSTTGGIVRTSSDSADPVVPLVEDAVLRSADGQSFRVSGGNLQLYNPISGKWHTIYAYGPEDEVQIGIGQEGEE